MFDETTTTAESSPAEHASVESFSPEQREKFFSTGELPEPESAPDPKETKGSSADSPTDLQEKQLPSGAKPETEARFRELLEDRKRQRQENQELRERLARLEGRFEAKPSDSPPDKPKEPQKPQPDDFDTYSEYVEALTEWKAEQKIVSALEADREQRAKESALDAQKREQQTAVEKFQERVSAVKDKLENFEEVINAATVELPAQVFQYMLDSESGPALMYELARNGEAEAKRIAALKPAQQLAALARMEAKLEQPEPAKPPVKKITDAKNPPTQVSGQSSVAEDEAAAAVKAGDFARYKAIMDRREIAAKRG